MSEIVKCKKCINCAEKNKINSKIKEKVKNARKVNSKNNNIASLDDLIVINLITFIDAVSSTFENQQFTDFKEAENFKKALEEAKVAATKFKNGTISLKEFNNAVNSLTEAAQIYSKVAESNNNEV